MLERVVRHLPVALLVLIRFNVSGLSVVARRPALLGAPTWYFSSVRLLRNKAHVGIRRLRAVAAALLVGALVSVFVFSGWSCNDGSTGCCTVCQGTCACGDSCVPCGTLCKKPKGCACTSAGQVAGSGQALGVGEIIGSDRAADAAH
jgi:hypothetical protein